MAYIFMDESGSLTGEGKYFIMTFLFSEKRKPIELVATKTFKSLNGKIKNKHCGSLHCVEERPVTRKRMLNHLIKICQKYKDISSYYMILEKDNYRDILIDKQNFLYNDITKNLLKNVLEYKGIDENYSIDFVASQRSKNKFINDGFKKHIQKNTKFNLNIILDMPHKNKSLQVVDFISWSLFRKYEFNDQEYFDIIKSILGDKLFYDKKIR